MYVYTYVCMYIHNYVCIYVCVKAFCKNSFSLSPAPPYNTHTHIQSVCRPLGLPVTPLPLSQSLTRPQGLREGQEQGIVPRQPRLQQKTTPQIGKGHVTIDQSNVEMSMKCIMYLMQGVLCNEECIMKEVCMIRKSPKYLFLLSAVLRRKQQEHEQQRSDFQHTHVHTCCIHRPYNQPSMRQLTLWLCSLDYVRTYVRRYTLSVCMFYACRQSICTFYQLYLLQIISHFNCIINNHKTLISIKFMLIACIDRILYTYIYPVFSALCS